MGNLVTFLEVTEKGADDMGDFVTEIGKTITPANMWATVVPIAAIVAALVVFKLGYRVLKDNVNGATKPKGRAMK